MSIQALRREKLDRLIQRGIQPFAYAFDPTHSSAAIQKEHEALEQAGTKVRYAGRLMTKRGHGKTCFAHVKDAHGSQQVYFREDVLGPERLAEVMDLDLGDWIGVEGTVFTTKTGEITIRVERAELLAKALRPLPEKWHGLTDVEIRYRQRYTDLVVNDEVRRVFRQRAAIIRELRAFLDARGFLEVETPVLQPVYGGASARPFVTHHNALDMDLYLRIADELYLKRLIVGGLERVYEISKDFRNEGIDRTHNPEFTMLEFYQAFADYESTMETSQALILHVLDTVVGSRKIEWEGKAIDFTPPWRRLTIADAAAEGLGVKDLPRDERALRGRLSGSRLRLRAHPGRDRVGQGAA
ncbi:MAG TPA: amino acid--tRNA ligase-related protein, partial [Candidatus Polarisedimenticolia bacterium]|nr:amino acid--tRNA ligase-related protein [Candidatus Polarisedimenticolia bacterium]